MKKTIILPALLLLAALTTLSGCIEDDIRPGSDSDDRAIMLGLEGPSRPADADIDAAPDTRAPLDEWENTRVNIAYRFFGTQNYFDKALRVVVFDPETENDGEYIETGLEYPLDDTEVAFRGYYPPIAPTATGTLTYDIARGDVDVMLSNTLTGSLSDQIPTTDKLTFEHQLTRVSFIIHCSGGQSYPEIVYGIKALSNEAATSPKPLGTVATIDLASSDGPEFKITGPVFAGDFAGFIVPPYGNPGQYVVLDMMLQPDVPLKFVVSSLTGDRNIARTSDFSMAWDELENSGGRRGVHYTIDLSFGGEIIVAQSVTLNPWIDGDQTLDNNDGTSNGTWY